MASGNLTEVDGHLRPTECPAPQDPALLSAFNLGHAPGSWPTRVAENERVARTVRDQLERSGWLCQPHRRFGVFTVGLNQPVDEAVCGALATEVRQALRSEINGRSADPRLLTLGLLAAHAQIDCVLTHEETLRTRNTVRRLTQSAGAPVRLLPAAIEHYHDQLRSGMGSAV